jgi:putative transposase
VAYTRRHPAHMAPVDKHNRPTILHVTVVVRDARPVLCSDVIHRTLRDCWLAASQWVVGSYVIMPEHVHLFCAPGCVHPEAVRRWCGFWKRTAARRCQLLKGAWLPDCWDTQIRNGDHYSRKLEYVRDNPVRRRLVAHWEEWPYRGTLNDLMWLSD